MSATDKGPPDRSDRPRSDPDEPAIVSYYTLRTLIGVAGIALPTAVWAGTWMLDGQRLLTSISTYYYSSTRDVFVGILLATGAFLATYEGYTKKEDRLWGVLSDNALTNLAGLAAVGIALFPTGACETARCTVDFPGAPWTEASAVHWLHVGSAGIFFLSMGVMARFLFTRSDRSKPGGERRHWTYMVCGTVILACVAFLIVYALLPDGWQQTLERFRPVFWGEAIAIWAFGIAWLTKGRGLTTSRELFRKAFR